MRRNIEQIEIQEPPIQEITKKKSCARKSCTTGCGCIMIFLVASLILLKFTTGPRVKNLDQLPTDFPETIHIYDSDNITKISFVSGKEQNQILEAIAFIPKLIFSPIILTLDNKWGNQTQTNNTRPQIDNRVNWQDWLKLIKEPVTDKRDLIQIEWTALSAEPRFVFNYYKNELEKTNFVIENETNNDEKKEFNFKLDQIEGSIYIEDLSDNKGTDFVSMTVKVPRVESK
ncbi:MAG: hypothetical protein WA057_02255 [Candidatus Magasanikiibacteriota bacterium]